MKGKILIKRVYEAPQASDGRRILVERLWPRGIKKEALHHDAWAREVAPSTALRKWFGHKPEKWAEFERRYRAELDANPEPWREMVAAAKQGPVTLLFSSHDLEHNNAVTLRAFLEAKLER